VLLRQGVVQMIGNSSEALLAYRKQLHEDESRALNESALQLKEKAAAARAAALAAASATPAATPLPEEGAGPATDAPSVASRSSALSFGDMEAEVLKVTLRNAAGDECSHFEPRETVRVEIACLAHQDLSNLNVGLRIRNKEGVKLYSWGTLNQDMAILGGEASGDVFWYRKFEAGQRFVVAFDFVCGLGPNLHEIQASITREGKPYYAEQHMLHWMDEAAFFTVTTNANVYHFGGVADLRMRAQPLEQNHGI
jgi:lipopolysaccharide transport system ATP-binding protein